MPNLINFSDAVNLAFHTLGVLASRKGDYIRTNEIAGLLKVSTHHLQKVHQRLTKMGLIQAARGPKGGFSLKKPAQEITLLEVYEAMEGPFSTNQCLLGRPQCEPRTCALGNMVCQINTIVHQHLKQLTIDKLLASQSGEYINC